jgi:tetratricopeptide (TPR) repeat protein
MHKPQDFTRIQDVLRKAEELIHLNKLTESETLLATIEGENIAGFWFLKGLLMQKAHIWGEAINCFNKCLDLDPNHNKAAAGIEICKSILNFWNPSLYNP